MVGGIPVPLRFATIHAINKALIRALNSNNMQEEVFYLGNVSENILKSRTECTGQCRVEGTLMANKDADTFGDTAATARSIAFDTTVTGWIDATFNAGVPGLYEYDDDWFVFAAEEGTDYTILFENLGELNDFGGGFAPIHINVTVAGGSVSTVSVDFTFGDKFQTTETIEITPDLSDFRYANFDGNYYVQLTHSAAVGLESNDSPYSIRVESDSPPSDPLPNVIAPDPGTPEASLFATKNTGKARRQDDREITYFFDNGLDNGGLKSDYPWEKTEKDAVKAAMAQISKYVDVSFTKVTDIADADWHLVIQTEHPNQPKLVGSFEMPGGTSPQQGTFYSNGKGWDEEGGKGL